jgi:murein DD-endopeptidase MepM/ murein hydrolase activator NlpD
MPPAARLCASRLRAISALAVVFGLGLTACGETEDGQGNSFVEPIDQRQPGDPSAPDPTLVPDNDAGAIDDEEEPFVAQFVWPAPAWVAANDRYPDGANHSGSADLALPYWTPVGASRGGVVARSEWTRVGGYLVSIEHEDGYGTLYSHLSEAPVVSVGQTVVTGQLLGYSGRTGNAFRNGAHLHFSITKERQRVVIPDLDLGDWVHRGDPIPGAYGSLPLLVERGASTFDVKVTAPSAPLFAAPDQTAAKVGGASSGDVLTVIDSASGYYGVTVGNRTGWLVHTTTVPVKSALALNVIVANNANVRSGPNNQDALLGTIPNGSLVTVFEQAGEWQRVLFGLPTVYAWTHTSNTAPTTTFGTRIRAKVVTVRSAPNVGAPVIGELRHVAPIRIEEVREGWYRIEYEGQPGWLGGWLTQGPL